MKKSNRYIKTLIILACLTAAGVAAWATWNRPAVSGQDKAEHADDSVTWTEPKPIDQALLKKMQSVCKQVDPAAKEYFISGSITMSNGADSTQNASNLEYIFTRSGTDCYYKIGPMETINSGGLNLFIDRENRRIMVSRQKEIVTGDPFPKTSVLLENLESEGYELTASAKGQSETLSLLNENHITCKEYTVTYHTASQQAERLYVRMSNFEFPEDKTLDKVIDLRITKAGSYTDRDKFAWTGIVQVNAGEVTLAPAYKDYELILL